MAEISNMDDIIDSREVIASITELQGELDDLEKEVEDRENSVEIADAGAETAAAEKALGEAQDALDNWREDNQEELDELTALQEEAEDCGDWKYGETLIRESHFEDYCQEMLQDIGALPRDLPNYLVIDWAATADNLRVDYTHVDFGGQVYLIRS